MTGEGTSGAAPLSPCCVPRTNVGTKQALSLPLNSQTSRRAQTWRGVPGITAEFRASYRTAAPCSSRRRNQTERAQVLDAKTPQTDAQPSSELRADSCTAQQYQPHQTSRRARVLERNTSETQPCSGLRTEQLRHAAAQPQPDIKGRSIFFSGSTHKNVTAGEALNFFGHAA